MPTKLSEQAQEVADEAGFQAVPDEGSRFSIGNRALRVLWGVAWLLLFRPTPRPMYAWRNALLRLFGAKIGSGVHVMATVKIWAPWNLSMADHSAMGEHVDCYSVSPIELGAHSVVSQYSFLCTASHSYEVVGMRGFDAPIRIGAHAWIAADVFVAPGVTVGEGTVVGARSSVFSDMPPWVVAVGSPARPTKKREMRGAKT